jgi:hypothetical protein
MIEYPSKREDTPQVKRRDKMHQKYRSLGK